LTLGKNLIVNLWESFRSRIFKFAFSRYYAHLLRGGAWRSALLNEFAPREGARVLQVHLQGTNISDEFLAKYPGCSLTSVSPFSPNLEPDERAQRLTFENGRISCDGASFDNVVCCMALHPLAATAKLALLNEMRRVLRAGGTLHLADLDRPSPKVKRWPWSVPTIATGTTRPYRTATAHGPTRSSAPVSCT